MTDVHEGAAVVVEQQALHLEDFLEGVPVVHFERCMFALGGMTEKPALNAGGCTPDVGADEDPGIARVRIKEDIGPHGIPGVLFDVVSVQDVRAHFSFTFRRRFDRAQCPVQRVRAKGKVRPADITLAPSEPTQFRRCFLEWLSSPTA